MSADELKARAARIGDQALDLEAGDERDGFIATACGTDEVLKELVLKYVRGADVVLVEPVFEEPPQESAYEDRRIGAWRLLRPLGEGGFGVVYLAERSDGQVRQLGAIKFLKGTVHSQDLQLRFLDERQVLANLNHPWIVRLIDAGLSQEGQPYLVMEYIENAMPIDAYCREHALTTAQVLKLFSKVCEAVAYAHRKLLVHRDLKPANVLIAADGNPRLLDFGVAKILDPIHRGSSRAADTSLVLLGTERYFSPEQARREVVDTTSDVYSLGVMLYELLVGADPYELQRRVRESIERIICTVDPELPSKALARLSTQSAYRSAHSPDAAASALAPASFEPHDAARRSRELAGDLDAILLQALRKERDQRYSSVTALTEDIQRHLDSVPVHARPATALYRLGRFITRNRQQVIAATLVLLALTGGLAAALYQRAQALRQQHIATARELSAYANQFLPGDPQRALALAIYAVDSTFSHHEPTVPAAENALHQATWLSHGSQALAEPGDGPVAFNASGHLLATTRASKVDLWDSDSGERRLSVDTQQIETTALGLSANGHLLAVGAADGTVTVWDLEANRLLSSTHTDDGPITQLAFSPDDQLLATGGDARCQVWNFQSRQVLLSLVITPQTVRGTIRYSLARLEAPRAANLAPGGQTVSDAGTARMTLAWHSMPNQAAVHQLLINVADGTAEEWDIDKAVRLLLLDPVTVGIGGAFDAYQVSAQRSAFSASGTSIATLENGRVTVWRSLPASASEPRRGDPEPRNWSASNGMRYREWVSLGGPEDIKDVALSQNGDRVLTVSDSGAKVWDLRYATPLQLLTLPATRAQLSADGQQLATLSAEHELKLWDVKPEQELSRFPGHGTVFSADGGRLASLIRGGVQVQDPSTQRSMQISTARETVNVLGFSPDGQRLAGASDESVRVWDAASGRELLRVTTADTVARPAPLTAGTDDFAPTSVAFSPDGKSLLAADDSHLFSWDSQNGRRILALEYNEAQSSDAAACPASAAFSSDGRQIAALVHGVFRLISAGTGTQALMLQATSGSYCSASLSPDGRWLALGDQSGSIQIWDKAQARIVRRLHGHNGPVQSVAFAPDSLRLASGGSDGTLVVWNVDTGEPRLTFDSHTDRVWKPLAARLDQDALLDFSPGFGSITSVLFSADGKHLVVTDSQPEVRVYSLDTAQLLALARSRLARPSPLSAADCQTYLHARRCPAIF